MAHRSLLNLIPALVAGYGSPFQIQFFLPGAAAITADMSRYTFGPSLLAHRKSKKCFGLTEVQFTAVTKGATETVGNETYTVTKVNTDGSLGVVMATIVVPFNSKNYVADVRDASGNALKFYPGEGISIACTAIATVAGNVPSNVTITCTGESFAISG